MSAQDVGAFLGWSYTMLLQEGLQSSRAAPEAKSINAKDGLLGRTLVAFIPGALVFALHS